MHKKLCLVESWLVHHGRTAHPSFLIVLRSKRDIRNRKRFLSLRQLNPPGDRQDLLIRSRTLFEDNLTLSAFGTFY